MQPGNLPIGSPAGMQAQRPSSVIPPAASVPKGARKAVAKAIAEPATRAPTMPRFPSERLNGDIHKLEQMPFADLAPEPWVHADSPIEEAATPPSSWYITDEVWQYEKQTVFARNWVAVGHTKKLQKPGDFLTGKIADTSYIVVKGEDGELRAFHNVCRHHAAPVSMEASGHCAEYLECPYHGWRYDLDGRFRGADKMKGIKNFDARRDASMVPIRMDTWGHFIFLLIDPTVNLPPVAEWLGQGGKVMSECEMESPDMVHVKQMSYELTCNWKVYADNYLDGCYHCPIAHPGLSQTLDIDLYHSKLYERVNFQFAPLQTPEGLASADSEWDSIISTRIQGDGRGPSYAFVYPNFMVNRYGMWMGTILISPTGPKTCTVYMDYWVHESKVDDEKFIEDVVQGEHIVQMEDVALCDLVQDGIFSPVYETGRYAPEIEQPMLHFHHLLNKDFTT